MTRVKICGIKTEDEALMARRFGAWAIGEVLAPSSRRISWEQAATINRILGSDILKVGIFVDEPLESLLQAVKECKFDLVQLHGEEPPEYVQEITVPVIKAFSVTSRVNPKEIKRWRVWAYLFDNKAQTFKGGSGKTFDWSLLSEVKGYDNLILAGGINAANAAQAIQGIRPMALDVSSGVEYPEGGKDPLKIIQFIDEIHRADSMLTTE